MPVLSHSPGGGAHWPIPLLDPSFGDKPVRRIHGVTLLYVPAIGGRGRLNDRVVF